MSDERTPPGPTDPEDETNVTAPLGDDHGDGPIDHGPGDEGPGDGPIDHGPGDEGPGDGPIDHGPDDGAGDNGSDDGAADNGPTDDGAADDGPATPADPPKRLGRRTEDRVLAGVAGGLGDYFNVDPAVFRLAFVALTFFGGAGIVLYLLGWLLLPEQTKATSIGEDLVRGAGGGRSIVGIVLIAVAVLILADNITFLRGSLVWAAVLIAIGVLLFRTEDKKGRQPSTKTATSPPTPPPAPTDMTAQLPRDDTTPIRPPTTTERTWRPTPYVPPRPPREPSPLGRLTVAGGLIAIGVVALLHNLDILRLTPAQFIAIGVTAVGIGLLIGAWRGRARGLIILGAILVPPMLLVSLLPVSADLSGGQRFHRPTTVDEVQPSYELTAGELHIDLSAIELAPGQQLEVDASLGLGELEVRVPADTTIEADASVGAGQASILGRSTTGSGVSLSNSAPGPEGAGTIILHLQNGVGEIDVQRARAGSTDEIGAGQVGDALTFVAVDVAYEDAPARASAGPLTVELMNDGGSRHDVVIEELGDQRIVEASGGETATGQVELEPGTYTYYCSVSGHRAAGMEGTLTVGEPTTQEGTR